jgi:hypothetical protein
LTILSLECHALKIPKQRASIVQNQLVRFSINDCGGRLAGYQAQ